MNEGRITRKSPSPQSTSRNDGEYEGNDERDDDYETEKEEAEKELKVTFKEPIEEDGENIDCIATERQVRVIREEKNHISSFDPDSIRDLESVTSETDYIDVCAKDEKHCGCQIAAYDSAEEELDENTWVERGASECFVKHYSYDSEEDSRSISSSCGTSSSYKKGPNYRMTSSSPNKSRNPYQRGKQFPASQVRFHGISSSKPEKGTINSKFKRRDTAFVGKSAAGRSRMMGKQHFGNAANQRYKSNVQTKPHPKKRIPPRKEIRKFSRHGFDLTSINDWVPFYRRCRGLQGDEDNQSNCGVSGCCLQNSIKFSDIEKSPHIPNSDEDNEEREGTWK